MLTDAQISDFHGRGFLNGGRLLDDGQVETLRLELDRVIEDRDRPDVPQPVSPAQPEPEPGHACLADCQYLGCERPLSQTHRHAKGRGGGRAAYRSGNGFAYGTIRSSTSPRSGAASPCGHQDAPLWPILAPMTEVSAWVALDDVDESNGCMSMVPGSHRWGDQIDFIRSVKNYEDMPGQWNGRPRGNRQVSREEGRGALPPRADLARIARQYERPPPGAQSPSTI